MSRNFGAWDGVNHWYTWTKHSQIVMGNKVRCIKVKFVGGGSTNSKGNEPESSGLMRSPSLPERGELDSFLPRHCLDPHSLSSCRNYPLLAHSIFTWRMQKASTLALLSNHTLLRWMRPKSLNLEVQLLII